MDVMAGVFRTFSHWCERLPRYQRDELHFNADLRDRVCCALMNASTAGVRDNKELAEIAAKAAGWDVPTQPMLLEPTLLPRARGEGAQPVCYDTIDASP
jgi:hypothetical protein